MFIVDREYDKFPLFCSNCKMIYHDLFNYRRLKQKLMLILVGRKQLEKDTTILSSKGGWCTRWD